MTIMHEREPTKPKLTDRGVDHGGQLPGRDDLSAGLMDFLKILQSGMIYTTSHLSPFS